MGISALKPVLGNIGNSQRNRRKNVETLRQKRSEYEKKNMECFNLILFLVKKRTYRKYTISIIFSLFRDIDKNIMRKFLFSRGFRQFLSECSIFLKTGLTAEIPIKRDRILFIE